MPRYFAQFDEKGNRRSSLAEDVNFSIIPPQPIVKCEKGKEIIITLPAYEALDETGEIVFHEEEKLHTGKYEKIESIIGYTEETIEPPIPEGFIEISEQEQMLYSNGYIRDTKTGQPVEAPPYVPTEEERRAMKLAEIRKWTAKTITGGFISAAKGSNHMYDSTVEDQANLDAMYNASRSANFVDDPVHQGDIPIRCFPEGKTGKIIMGHNAEEMQRLIDDKARHISTCKKRGWELQEMAVKAQTEEEFAAIVW